MSEEKIPVQFEYSGKKFLLELFFIFDKQYIAPQYDINKAARIVSWSLIYNYGTSKSVRIVNGDFSKEPQEYSTLKYFLKDTFKEKCFYRALSDIYGRETHNIDTFNRLWDKIEETLKNRYNSELYSLYQPLCKEKLYEHISYAKNKNHNNNVIYAKMQFNSSITIFTDNFSQILFYECAENNRILEKHLADYCGEKFAKKFFSKIEKELKDVL